MGFVNLWGGFGEKPIPLLQEVTLHEPNSRRRNTPESNPVLRQSEDDSKQQAVVRASWGQWIAGYDWTHFVTFTFRDVGRIISAHRACHEVTRRAFRITGTDSRAVIAGEYGSATGRYHLHGLLNMDDCGLVGVVDWWRAQYGITHDRRYDAARGASGYVAKYITKELTQAAEVAIDIYPGSSKWRSCGIRPAGLTWYDRNERDRLWRKNEKIEVEITQGQETPLSKEEKAQIAETLRQENRQIAARYKAEWEWLDARPLTGYDRYIAELGD